MLRGRIEREVKRVIKEKGIPYNEKMFQRMKRERYEAISKAQFSQYQEEEEEQKVEDPPVSHRVSQERRGEANPMVLSVEVEEGRI